MSGILPVELGCWGGGGGEGRTVGVEPKSFFLYINASKAGGRGDGAGLRGVARMFPGAWGAGLSWRRSQLDCIIFLMGGAKSLVGKGEARSFIPVGAGPVSFVEVRGAGALAVFSCKHL